MTEDNTGSIPQDELVDDIQDVEFDATDAFLKAAGGEEDEHSAPSDEPEDGTSTGDETPAATEDDPEFDIKVGEDTRKAKLSDLKRLYGQEAMLTQKSQIVAELRSKAETDSQRATLALTSQTERAQAAWKPYSELDFLALSTQMDPADFQALRSEAKAALDNVTFFTTELDGIQKATTERQAATARERATATIAELSDPVKGIKDWGPQLYGDVMAYATSQGIPDAAARSIVEAPALRLLHKAMLYDRQAAKAPAVATKVIAKPTVTLKPGNAKTAAADTDSFQGSLRSMRERGGTLDSTADAFAAHARRAS